MKELRRSSPIILRKSVLTCRKAELAFFVLFCFFLFGLSFTNIMIHRTAGKGEGYLFISLLSLPTASQTFRH